MEGTNANEPCRIGSIRPRRQARERRSLQPSKSQVPSGKTMVSKFEWRKHLGDFIAMEGTNANEPCQIGSIRPRRQARERRSLLPILGNRGHAQLAVTLHLLRGPLESLPVLLLLETARSEDP